MNQLSVEMWEKCAAFRRHYSKEMILWLTLHFFLFFSSFSSLKPTTCCQAGTTFLATIRTASFVSGRFATLELKPQAFPRNSQESNLPWPPWRATFACPSSVTTLCLEVFDLRCLQSVFAWGRRVSSCHFTTIDRSEIFVCLSPVLLHNLIFIYW